jgi:hypothetical protein
MLLVEKVTPWRKLRLLQRGSSGVSSAIGQRMA